MLHRLLACLALITGLTLTGAPAHARNGDVAPAQMEQSVAGSAARMAVVLTRSHSCALTACLPERDGGEAAEPAPVHPPTVVISVDRARE